MRHAKKTEFILNLEREPERKFLTVAEAMPKISLIAKDQGLNLTNPKDWKIAVRIMDSNNLNR